MTAPTLTYGDGFLDDLTEIFYVDYENPATSNGTTQMTYDTNRNEVDDTWNGNYIKFISGENAGLFRLILSWTQSTHLFVHAAFPYATQEGDEYILSKIKRTAISGITDDQADIALDPADVLKITVTADQAASYEYVEHTIYVIPSISTTQYPKYLVRFKGDAIPDGRLYIEFIYDVGSKSVYISSGETADKWIAKSGTLDTGKTLESIKIRWGKYGTGTVSGYIDFIKVCKGIFTFPHVAADGRTGGVRVSHRSVISKQHVPGRSGTHKDNMGLDDPRIFVRGDKLDGESWGTPFGEVFHEIMRNDTWAWFTSDQICCKVLIEDFTPNQDASETSEYLYELTLIRHSPSDLNDPVWDGIDGFLGIE